MLIGRREAALLDETARALFRREGVRPTRATYRPPIELAPTLLRPGLQATVPIVAGLRLEPDETLPPGVIRVVGSNFVADVRTAGVVPTAPAAPVAVRAIPRSLLRGLLAGQQ